MTIVPAKALARATASAPAVPPAARGMWRNLGHLLSSNVLVGGVGVLSLPFLARNLGAAGYGDFSLFLTGLGLLSSLDIARPTLVRELSGGDEQRARLLTLTGSSQLVLSPLALLVGAWFFGPAAGCALALGVFLFIACSAPYAALAARGEVGRAAAVRNLGWAAAFVASTGLSFLEGPIHLCLWPFVLANAAIFAMLSRLAGDGSGRLWRRPDWGVVRHFKARSLDILGLSLAVAVVVSADKLLLKQSASGEVFGRYTAQYDLAAKLNMLSTALGTVLFPAFASLYAERGLEVAGRRLVRVLTWVSVAYFLGLSGLLWFSDELLGLMLGTELAGGTRIYPWMLVGIFLALFGHVLTPWQRACGDFRTHRRAYALSAVLMLCVGLYAVPRFGAAGALMTYLSARAADLMLIAAEVARLPRTILGWRHLAALGAMVGTLAWLAWSQLQQVGGL